MIYVSLQAGEGVCFSFQKVYVWSLKSDLTQHNDHSHITSSHLHKADLCSNEDIWAPAFHELTEGHKVSKTVKPNSGRT